jgi:hypothetical protein
MKSAGISGLKKRDYLEDKGNDLKPIGTRNTLNKTPWLLVCK